MTDDKREWARPVEEVAREIYEARNGFGAMPWSRREGAYKAPYRLDAKVAIATLRRLGMIHEDGLKAIREEERK